MKKNISLLSIITILLVLLYTDMNKIYAINEEKDQNMTIVLNKQEHDRLIKYFFDKFDGKIMLSNDMRLYNSDLQCQEIILVKEYFSDKNNLKLRLFLRCQSDYKINIKKKANYYAFYIYTTNYYGKHDVKLEVSSYDDGLGLDCLLVDMDYNAKFYKDKKERGDIYEYCSHLSHPVTEIYTRDNDNYLYSTINQKL